MVAKGKDGPGQTCEEIELEKRRRLEREKGQKARKV